ncbi:D-amino acid dehydrogenase [Roseomonas sp. CCTCC AB2023176]|uniref:D-amino acid dehydrogenase n=1 Tax=Roseomonas sp. CCTCC AB2023176 TaxID=3342640 RepID=UPI0035D7E990
MKVLVLGAGVTGLAAAYCLARDGHAVTILERRRGVALETSHANGGQLSYSYVAPLAGPGIISKLPVWLLRGDSPVRFRPRLDPHQWEWGLRFLAACNARDADLSTRRLLLLSFLSRDLTRAVIEDEAIDCAFRHAGKLVVYSDAPGFEAAKRLLDYQRQLGSEQEALTAAECLTIEPSLSRIAHRLAGGILTRGEDAAECRLFCAGLESAMRDGNLGVEFRFGQEARQILLAGNRVVGVATDQDVIEPDAVVMSMGVGATRLLRPLGIRAPIYPLKGYSLTLPIHRDDAAPRISVTDYAHKTVYARLGRDLRVAGMADIVGYSTDFDLSRLDLLIRQAQEAFPDATDWRTLRPWAGLRPATPSWLPILGPAPGIPNLHLNIGHGGLGFTLAMGSGRVVADLLAGRPAPIPLDGFTP